MILFDDTDNFTGSGTRYYRSRSITASTSMFPKLKDRYSPLVSTYVFRVATRPGINFLHVNVDVTDTLSNTRFTRTYDTPKLLLRTLFHTSTDWFHGGRQEQHYRPGTASDPKIFTKGELRKARLKWLAKLPLTWIDR